MVPERGSEGNQNHYLKKGRQEGMRAQLKKDAERFSLTEKNIDEIKIRLEKEQKEKIATWNPDTGQDLDTLERNLKLIKDSALTSKHEKGESGKTITTIEGVVRRTKVIIIKDENKHDPGNPLAEFSGSIKISGKAKNEKQLTPEQAALYFSSLSKVANDRTEALEKSA